MGEGGEPKVLVALKINPEDIDTDLERVVEELKSRLPPEMEVVKYDKVYVAFGLYALRVYVLMPEKYEGGTERLEEVLKGVPGVSSVDIEMVTRVSAF